MTFLEILYLVASKHKMVLSRFWFIFLYKFRCCTKFSISLTQWYRTKLHEIIPDTDSLKLIILKLKAFTYNSIRNVIFNFCLCGACPLHRSLDVNSSGDKFFYISSLIKSASKCTKRIFEWYVCDNLNQIITVCNNLNRLFSILTK